MPERRPLERRRLVPIAKVKQAGGLEHALGESYIPTKRSDLKHICLDTQFLLNLIMFWIQHFNWAQQLFGPNIFGTDIFVGQIFIWNLTTFHKNNNE